MMFYTRAERAQQEVSMIKRILAAAMMLGVLAGCATSKYVVADVTRFHTLSAGLSGRTFAIVAVSPDQEQSIAFHNFADVINGRLTAMGMNQYQGNAGPQAADYVINLHYGVTGPTPDVRTRGGYGRGWYGPQFGFGYSHWGRHSGFGINYGFPYDPFWDDDIYIDTRQLFVRRVELDIYRGSSYTSDRKERVFEGRAISSGLNGQIEPVMPYMLDAIFRDFPGPSGTTNTVRVEVPPDVERRPSATARSSY
jgi:hypothetical protein